MKQLVLSAMLALLASGCASVTWVNDVSSSPDGRMVTVVGAEFQAGFGGWTAKRPLTWNCLRNEAGQLSCRPDATELPQLDEDAPPAPAPPPAAAPVPAPAPPPPAPAPAPVEQPAASPPPAEAPAPADTGCTSDGECKGSRVCKDGQCVAP